MRWKISAALITAATLGGCTTLDDQLSGRYGPAPVLVTATVEASVGREAAVVAAIARGAGFVDALPPYGDRERWYNVILMGFNTVDDACMTYIDDLWILERRKTRNSTIIHVTAAAVAAIIGANPNPSAATLTILAQAFGLAGALNNAIADSYLYSQNAATIKKLVKKTTGAYRDDLAKNFAIAPPARPEVIYPIASPAAAYFHMREYLALCLPPSIQAQIEDLVAKAKAAPEGSPDAQKVSAEKQRTGGPAPSASFMPSRTVPAVRTAPRIEVF